jgi:hypothetical protein
MKSYFVSYNQADQAWAKWIAWRLEEAGHTTVLQDWDFLPGSNFIVEMQRATEQTDHTIAVLSSNYLSSQFGQPEWAAALGSDPTGQAHRLIPVRVGECDVRGMLKQIVWIDLVGLTEQAASARLLERVTTRRAKPSECPTFPGLASGSAPSQDRSVPTQPRFPGSEGTPRDAWLLILNKLLQIPAVQKAVVACQVDCDAMCEQIDDLMNYKDLHDQLHQLQFNCYEPIVRTIKGSELDETAREVLSEYELNFREIVGNLGEIDSRLPAAASGAEWIQRLADARQDLARAIEAADPALLQKAAGDVRRVLHRQPSRINEWIILSARELRLANLVQALTEVCDELSERDIEPGRVATFRQGLAGLSRLTDNLGAVRDDHAQWQTVDSELRVIDAWLDRSTEELVQSWPHLKRYIDPLCSESSDDWAVQLRAAGERLERALRSNDGAAVEQFRRFRRQAGLRFFKVDTNMKRLCEQLRLTGLPLASALKVMQ